MIKKISIQNFKSIKNMEVELPKFVAIVGRNSAGKTNLLQAIGMIKNLVLGSNLDDEQFKISLIPSELFNFSADSANEFAFKMTVSTREDVNYELSFSVQIRTDNQKQSLIISKEKLQKTDPTSNNPETIYTRTMDILQNGDTVIPLAIDQNKLAIVTYKNKETDDVKNIFKNILIPDFEDLYNLNSIGVSGIERKNSTSVQLADILIDLRHDRDETKYQNFLKIIKKFMPNFKSLTELPAAPTSDNAAKNQFMVLLDERHLTSSLSMRSISAGDIRTLYLIASSLSMEDDSCLVIEEIENGIHPKRITDLIEQLDTIARIKNMQMIFTTHSPIVINQISPSRVILTQKREQEGTSFTLLGKSEQITKIKEFLENDGELTDYLFTKQ